MSTFRWPSAWRRHRVCACTRSCFYCFLVKKLQAPVPAAPLGSLRGTKRRAAQVARKAVKRGPHAKAA